MSKVAVIKTPIDYSDVGAAVRRAIELAGGLPLNGVKDILIKPNLVVPANGPSGMVTDNRVIAELIKMAQEAGASVSVGDSSGLRTRGSTETVLKETGVREMAEAKGAKVLNFDQGEMRAVPVPGGRVTEEVYLATAPRDASLVVNAPKLKTHILTKMTGAVKNMYGCVPGGQKSVLHRTAMTSSRFASLICDIFGLVNPGFTVMDAVVGLGGLWREEDTLPLGCILAGTDAVAVDAIGCLLLGIDPKHVPVLSIADKRGLGTIDLDDIEIVGDGIAGIPKPRRSRRLHVPVVGTNIAGLLLGNEHPELEKERCSGCRHCLEVCPANAIEFNNKNPEFDYEACIKCFCCLELCPERAIKVSRGRLGNLFLKA